MKRRDYLYVLVCLLVLMVLALAPILERPAPVEAQGNQQPGAYTYIHTATTTMVQASPGFLQRIVINGGTAGVVTLYDIGSAGCSGTPASGKFATIAALSAQPNEAIEYGLRETNGLCIVTAAATDITVVWNQ
jgi:hypothetical protein